MSQSQAFFTELSCSPICEVTDLTRLLYCASPLTLITAQSLNQGFPHRLGPSCLAQGIPAGGVQLKQLAENPTDSKLCPFESPPENRDDC